MIWIQNLLARRRILKKDEVASNLNACAWESYADCKINKTHSSFKKFLGGTLGNKHLKPSPTWHFCPYWMLSLSLQCWRSRYIIVIAIIINLEIPLKIWIQSNITNAMNWTRSKGTIHWDLKKKIYILVCLTCFFGGFFLFFFFFN